jgi:hypothetical protein
MVLFSLIVSELVLPEESPYEKCRPPLCVEPGWLCSAVFRPLNRSGTADQLLLNAVAARFPAYPLAVRVEHP